MAFYKDGWTRRRLLTTGAGITAGLAMPHVFTRGAWAQDQAFCNNPSGGTVTLGFNEFRGRRRVQMLIQEVQV